ncbi:MAG: transcriptional repressor [Myxococcota bacterium]
MPAAPPKTRDPGRRHRTRQRDRILAWLQSSEIHPTAGQVHAGLAGESPRLSLATVYRNLDVLVEAGSIRPVASGHGALRYDGNPQPHQHFICESCGEIIDVPLSEPHALRRRLAREHSLHAGRVSMIFYGQCPDCDEGPSLRERRAGERTRVHLPD